MPISFHVGGGRIPVPAEGGWAPQFANEDELSRNQHAYKSVTGTLGQLSGAPWLISIIMSGTCEKFPDFQFVMGECDAA